nr:fluoride efflux transporter CrcB [Mesorhizobium alhagi]
MPETEAKQKDGARWRTARDTALIYLAVSLGSVIGSVLRAIASMAALAYLGPDFPWGTLFVNVLGSFVIGFYATLTGPGGRVFAGTRQRQFVMAGICGGFTTFSMFSLETFLLVQVGNLPAAGLNIGASIVTWLAAVWLGHILASRLNRLGGV